MFSLSGWLLSAYTTRCRAHWHPLKMAMSILVSAFGKSCKQEWEEEGRGLGQTESSLGAARSHSTTSKLIYKPPRLPKINTHRTPVSPRWGYPSGKKKKPTPEWQLPPYAAQRRLKIMKQASPHHTVTMETKNTGNWELQMSILFFLSPLNHIMRALKALEIVCYIKALEIV